MPRQHDRGELADALERVGEHPDDIDERKKDDAQVRKVRAAVASETRLDPFRPGQHVRAAQPRAQKHHQKNLVEHGPKPRQPQTFQAIDEQNIDEPHRAADVEHAGGVRNSEQIPRQRFAAEKIGIQILGARAAIPRGRSK
jgi:hypothetical protein